MLRKAYILLMVPLLLAVGCERGFEELNQNPNIETIVEPDALFAQSVLKYHTDYLHGVLTETWSIATWTQMQASLNGISAAGDEYFIGGDGIDNSWRIFYSDVLGNVSEAIRYSETDASLSNHTNMYRIWRAYVMHRITDMWGAAPYSEAFLAVGQAEPNFSPAYDGQESIYTALLTELEEASAALDAAKSTPETQDWLYGGDVDKWKRFANTLRLRIALRMVNVNPTEAQAQATALMVENHFIDAAEDGAHFPHSNSARSPFYELDNTGQGMYNPSHFMVEMFKADGDPRLEQLATLAPQTIVFGAPDFVGVPNFMLSAEIDPDEWNDFSSSYISSIWQDANRPGVTLSAAESHFLQVEATFRGWAGAVAGEAMYAKAVAAHFATLGLPQSQADDYLQNGGAWQGTLEQIITEKWKTFVYTDPIEAWCEYRRTGFPVLTDVNGNAIDASRVPARLAYPASEISLNASNVQAVGEGINDFETRMWWDVD